MAQIPFQYNDGGRKEAGFTGVTGDCGIRAIAIVTGLPYLKVYNSLPVYASKEREGKRKRGISNMSNGIYIATFRKMVDDLGFIWTPTMFVGSGCTVHVHPDELPHGRLILNVSKHYTSMIDGVLHDIFDCSRKGTRCVYGYWKLKEV